MTRPLSSYSGMIAAFSSVAATVAVPMAFVTALSVSVAQTAHAQSFPYNASYNGESSILTAAEQTNANAATLQYWRDWRTNYIAQFGSNSKRVLFQETDGSSDRTVSEGIGYGMLLCVFMNDTSDHAIFDDLFPILQRPSQRQRTHELQTASQWHSDQ